MNKDNLLGFACICENIRTLGRTLSLKSHLVIKKWKRKGCRGKWGEKRSSFPFSFYSELLGWEKVERKRGEIEEF